MTPYYEESGITIYHGDCREILPSLPRVDLVLTDPPYGFNYNPSRKRATVNIQKGLKLRDREWTQIHGESEPFEPQPWLGFDQVILWGANHYADKLPASAGWLVWDKRDGVASDNQSDCELAWCSFGGSIRMYRQLWRGIARAGQENIAISGEKLHPHQKPVALMKWCVVQVPDACQAILDPFMGSGTTLRAAKDLGRKAIGIEIEERYCEIAAKRMAQQVLDCATA